MGADGRFLVITPSLLMTTISPGSKSRINRAPREVKAQLSEERRYVSFSRPRQRGRIP